MTQGVICVSGGRKKAAPAGRSPRTPRQRPPRKNPLFTDEEQGDEDFHPARKRGKKSTKPKLVFSSDEDSEIDMFSPDKGACSSLTIPRIIRIIRDKECFLFCLCMYVPNFVFSSDEDNEIDKFSMDKCMCSY